MGNDDFDVVIVGAGFAGIYLLHRLRALGLSVRVIEAGADVGGTWFWNRYPGLRCDVESMTYSYSFDDALQKEWTWTHRYAAQPEILRYLNHVVDRHDLRRDMSFNSRVVRAAFDETTRRWSIETETGRRYRARFCVMATGCLSVPILPAIESLPEFRGAWYHTADWPNEGVDFSGKRVAVIVTGSSGIQVIPVIAEQAAHLTVFQRTPNFSIPAHNGPLSREAIAAWKADYPALRDRNRHNQDGNIYAPPTQSALEVGDAEREAEFERRWREGSFSFLSTFTDIVSSRQANAYAADFVRRKIRATVKDPKVADRLSPTGYPFGTKRLCVDTNYYETFNRPNVDLVDLGESPLERATATGLRAGGRDYDFDIIVFATGYDAVTGALGRIDIRGRAGRALAEKWKNGPRTYLGVAVAGFPNLFTVTGPGSPAVFSNMIVSIEQHVEWIAGCIAWLDARDVATIEAREEAEDNWVLEVKAAADGTLMLEANSWYVGANVPGKPRMLMCYFGGVGKYRARCDAAAAAGYDGFILGRAGPQ